MRKTRNKEAHNALLRQYIKEIENPDRHGFIGGKWVQSPYKGDDPNNRGYGIDVLQNKAAAKLTQGRQGKWLTEDEERMLRNKHIKDVNDAVNNHYYKYLRRTPLSEEKEIMATGLLYRGDHINGTKLAEPYYNGSNTDFQKAVENYYRSKNLNDRAWRSKEFMDAHKSQSPFSTISLESPYVPMEYVGYHPNEDYYYAGELPQVDAYGEHGYADGGILYGNQDVMPSTPQEDYQQGEQADYQVEPRQWDDLSLSEKNAFIANAVQHGITNMEDIRNAYNELMQEQLNGNDSMDDMEDSHKFLKGGYKPSRYIKNFISHMEGASMKTNRSFEAEAKDFWNALPNNVKGKITQEQADALYSYSYNVGAGNFKNRVVPALERYFNGNGSVEDVQRHMYATKDNQLRGLAKRRAQERAMFAGSEVPVYYNEDYTPQSTNSQWRNSRLGPVTAKSFNISQGLGPVSNTSNTLGPVTSNDYMAQRNKENTEALANILYGSQPMTAFDAPQETTQETSSIDRYNEIQDLLSTPYTFANGGEKDSGVISTNGLYHASPSEYAGILDSVANNNPLEVTLPDTTVTVSDPSNYRSYYDPNGAAEFMDATTLGLFPHPFNLSRDASTFIQHPSWGNVWNTTKDALMLAGGAGYIKAFAPLGIMNLIDKDGVRKTYGLAKDGNYAGAVMSGLGDVLNAGIAAVSAYTIGKKVGNEVYNIYNNGTLFDKYTTLRGRFGNYGDNLLTNMYGTYTRRFGLPDKARIPADAIRKIKGGVNIMNDGMIDLTGNKGYKGNPHINVTLDRPVVSHSVGNWDGADTYLFPTKDLLLQAGNESIKSIEPSDMFINGSKIIEEPNKVTVISGDVDILKNAKKAGMQTLSSPKLRKMYKEAEKEYQRNVNKKFNLSKHPQDRANIAYATEVQRLQSQRGTPTLQDFRLLEQQTGLNAGVAPVSEYESAIHTLNEMKSAKISDIMNGTVKPFVYPNGREVDLSKAKIDHELGLIKKAKYNNVFYDPATRAEYNWRMKNGIKGK